jgi:hypothetical protein
MSAAAIKPKKKEEKKVEPKKLINMSLYGYTFIREVEEFAINDYLAYDGWVNDDRSMIRIYGRESINNYFLHDVALDKLFEFSYDSKAHIKESYEFQNAATAYYLRYPRNADR